MDKLLQSIYALVIVLSIACAFVYTQSAADGSSGYLNTHYTQFDERIAISDVNSILHPGDAKHFVFYVISGSTQQYGRFMMYTDAAFSFVPEKIWGLRGQVIATRMCHFLFLLLAIHLLISFFITDKLLQLSVLTFTLVSPYFIYFSFIPKPEPFVLFFLALFLRGFVKSGWSFGWHFIWLGFAYGCKISVLPLIPVFFALPVFYQQQKLQFSFNVKEIFKSILWLVVGFLICIPCLILSPVKPIFLHSYFSHTFGSVAKSSDSDSINFTEWFSHFSHHYFNFFAPLVFALSISAIAVALYSLYKQKKISNSHIIFGVGLIQILLIFIFTKRIWPHYLFIGVTISMIGFVAVCENFYASKAKFVSLFLLMMIVPQLVKFASDVQALTQVEKSDEYVEMKKNGTAAITYLLNKNIHKIKQDLSLFLPNDIVVKGIRYEPFPESKNKNTFEITGITDYDSSLYTSGYEAIVFEKYYPENYIPKFQWEYFMKGAAVNFSKYVPSYYQLDTTFGNTKIFLRTK